jgi:hypothetical protein
MADTSPKNTSAMAWDHVAPTPASSPSGPRDVAWTLMLDGHTIPCELRDESKLGGGWDVLIRQDGELSFSRRCLTEAHARYEVDGLKQDHVRTDWQE